MLLHRRTLAFAFAVAFGLALLLVLSKASSADHTDTHEPNPNGVAPDSFGGEPNTLRRFCEFPVLVEGSGKVKWIESGNALLISPAPGFTVTMTNAEEPENQITVSDTGVYHVTLLADGKELWETTGTIFLLFEKDFTEEMQQGIYLVHGQTTVVQDAKGNWDASTFRIEGQVTDVCAILA
jgi:hypothetical protein